MRAISKATWDSAVQDSNSASSNAPNGSRKLLILATTVVVIAIVAAGLIYKTQSDATDKHWSAATESFRKGEYENAAKELKGVAMPESNERLRIYGQTMLATRNLDKSLSAYKKLHSKTNDPNVELIIGNVYNEKKDYAKASDAYKAVIAANPNNTQAYVNLATMYQLQGNKAEAIRIAQDGVKNNPGSVTLSELRVSLLMDNKNAQEYKDAIEQLKKLNPDSQLLKSIKP